MEDGPSHGTEPNSTKVTEKTVYLNFLVSLQADPVMTVSSYLVILKGLAWPVSRHCHNIHPDILSIPLACAECDNSLLFSGASSIPLCYIPFPSTPLHQLVFHPPLLHLSIYFLVYLSALLFPNSYIMLLEILFSFILCTCPNQRNLFNLIVSVIVGFLTIA